MAIPQGVGGGSAPAEAPTQNGWYLFKCGDGTAGLAEWTGKWQGIPCSAPVDFHFVAPTIGHIQNSPATIWDNAAHAMGFTACQMDLISRGLDVSQQGQSSSPPPLFTDPACSSSSTKGFSNQGDAQNAGINFGDVGTALSGLVDTIKALFSADLWKGIGLIVAGGLVLIFVGMEVKKSI